jgi:imidazolonepropionase-like amidohydrolase
MSRQLVIEGGTVFTSTGETIHGGTVFIDDGVLAGVGPEVAHQPDAKVIDASGKFVMPGFIDAHTHLALWAPRESSDFQPETAFWAARAAREVLASGVTTVRDVGGVNFFDIALRNSIAKGEMPGPRMLVAGKFVEPTGGHVHYFGREADGVDEIRKAVREQLKAGVDVVKLMASGGAANVGENPDRMHLRPEELEAAVVEASEAGKPVSVHAHPPKAIRACAELGVTSVEHAKGLDDQTIEVVLKHGMWVVLTQAVYKRIAENVDGHPAGKVEIATKVWEEKLPTARAAVQAGVKIGIGTDCGRHYPHSGFVGEMLETRDLGLTNEQTLITATARNAELLGLSNEIGTLEVGKRGDVVILGGNPVEDLEQAWKVETVVQGGVPLIPADILRLGRV